VLRTRALTSCVFLVALAFLGASCTRGVTVATRDGTVALAAAPQAPAPPAAGEPRAAAAATPVAAPQRAAPAPASTSNGAHPAVSASAQRPAAASTPRSSQPAPTAPPAAAAAASRQQELTNQARASAGLAPLQWNSCLAGVAQLHSREMALAGHIYHGDGVQRDLQCGLGSNRSGENVGMTSPGIDENRIFAGFMGSAGHKANILGPYRYIGTAWITGSDGAGYVSVEFAS
jgi:uncharacterized protein YkwD